VWIGYNNPIRFLTDYLTKLGLLAERARGQGKGSVESSRLEKHLDASMQRLKTSEGFVSGCGFSYIACSAKLWASALEFGLERNVQTTVPKGGSLTCSSRQA
jgi:hypothetical protein